MNYVMCVRACVLRVARVCTFHCLCDALGPTRRSLEITGVSIGMLLSHKGQIGQSNPRGGIGRSDSEYSERTLHVLPRVVDEVWFFILYIRACVCIYISRSMAVDRVAMAILGVAEERPGLGSYLVGGMERVVDHHVRKRGGRRMGILLWSGLNSSDLFAIYEKLAGAGLLVEDVVVDYKGSDTVISGHVAVTRTVDKWLFGQGDMYFAEILPTGNYGIPPPSAFSATTRYTDADGRQYILLAEGDTQQLAVQLPSRRISKSTREDSGYIPLLFPNPGDSLVLSLRSKVFLGPTPPATGITVVSRRGVLLASGGDSLSRCIISVTTTGAEEWKML